MVMKINFSRSVINKINQKIKHENNNDIHKGMKKILSPSDHDLVTPPIILPITLPVTVLAANPALK